jgi:hypothetical protein
VCFEPSQFFIVTLDNNEYHVSLHPPLSSKHQPNMTDRITFATQKLFQIVHQQEAHIAQLRARLQELSNQTATSGRHGVDGKDGLNGADGKDGLNGADGKDGKDGKDGNDGENGKDGLNGADGKDGKDGENGKDGLNGADGKDGVNGAVGKTGATGKAGKAGKNGDSFSVDKLTNTDLVALKAKLDALA